MDAPAGKKAKLERGTQEHGSRGAGIRGPAAARDRGATQEDARARIPGVLAGRYQLSEKVLQEGGATQPRVVLGDSTQEARSQAEAAVPAGMEILGVRTLHEQGRFQVQVAAFTEADARSLASEQAGPGATVTDIKLVSPGKKGLMGMGKTPAQYSASGTRRAAVAVTMGSPWRIEVKSVGGTVGAALQALHNGDEDRGWDMLGDACRAYPKSTADMLLEILDSERMYQSLRTRQKGKKVGGTNSLKGIEYLLAGDPAAAQEQFEDGVISAQYAVASLQLGFSELDAARLVANMRRDCRVGAAIAMGEQGRDSQRKHFLLQALEQYEAEFPH